MSRFPPIPAVVRRISTVTTLAVVLVAGLLAIASPQPLRAFPSPGTVNLGTAGSFAVLAGSTVTNTGPSVVNDDVGVSGGSAITGFPPGQINNGTQHSNDALAIQGQTDLTAAYNDAASRIADQDLTGIDLGGLTLNAGVYNFDSSAGLTGTLTLDGQNIPNQVFIFQVGSTLTTASSSRVLLTNGAQACNVFWQIGSSATMGTNSTFVGIVLANAAITMTTGANNYGRLLARIEAVTLDSNTVTPSCATAVPDITVDKTASPTSRPAPGGLFTFTVTVTNAGSGTVTLTSLVDDVHGNLNGQGNCLTGGTIAAGNSYICSFTATVTSTETDTVTAIATDANQTPAGGSDTATVTITSPSVTVDKTASPTSRPEPGGPFTFTVGVTNTSAADVTLTSLVDDIYGDLNGQGNCSTGDTIAPGATYTCSFTGEFTGAAGASQTDIVTADVADSGGNTATAADDATVTITPTGVLEICKRADNANGAVTGNFTFNFADRSVVVPTGNCTGPLTVPAGNLTVTEVPRSGIEMVACVTRPADRLVLCDSANNSAVVNIVAGGVANETVLVVTNRAVGGPSPTTPSTSAKPPNTAPVKVCKVAGPGVPIGTNFRFTVGSQTVTVPAGPAAQGGYCKIVNRLPIGTRVTVTELESTGTRVSAIKVQPSGRRISSSTSKRTATIRVGSGFTVVTFTNRV